MQENKIFVRPEIDVAKTNENIFRLCDKSDISISNLASLLGISHQYLHRLRSGCSEKSFTLKNFSIIAAVLRVSIDDLLVYSNEGEFGYKNMEELF